ncbi:hypothetical protein ACIQXV_15345 [Neobacillus sp. NPDC097160]|uniref:hypothetical protein n=1 Tax=Neobacillus sp. NPDC097160 TaxID=3364298 RepID=UPI003814F6B1
MKSVNIGGYVYSISEMFEQFMLIKKGEGLAKRTINEYYKNFQFKLGEFSLIIS